MKKNGKKNDQATEATVFHAVRSLRWLLPQTEDEVRAIEIDEDHIELPASLLDPMDALGRGITPLSTEEPGACDPFLLGELAQAARQGAGAISPDVADRMRKDRDAAEREMERTDNE